MKYLMIVFLFLLSACQQLMRGQEQPVIQKAVKEQIFFTTCSGTVEDWGSCNNKAQRTCTNGYSILKRFENIGTRELTFQCK